MIVPGVDIGAATAKAVVLDSSEVLSFFIGSAGHSVTQAGESAIGEALKNVLTPAQEPQSYSCTRCVKVVHRSNKAIR